MYLHTGHNLNAYEGVEDINLFPDNDSICRYRRQRKQSYRHAVNFIKKWVWENKPLSVLEIGSGSSCFLYSLDDAGLLKEGVGIEIARSRHAFAESWRHDERYHRIKNICLDVRNYTGMPQSFDLCAVIDHTFAYFYPVDPNMPDQVLEQISTLLKSNGCLLLDLTIYEAMKKEAGSDGTIEHRIACNENGLFKEGIYKTTFYADSDIVETVSRYIRRDGTEATRKFEYSKMYTADSLREILARHGFAPVCLFEDFTEKPFVHSTAQNLVVLARKTSFASA